MEGSAKLTSPTNLFRLVPNGLEIIFTFYKIIYLTEEVNSTEPSPSVGIPWVYKTSSLAVPDFTDKLIQEWWVAKLNLDVTSVC